MRRIIIVLGILLAAQLVLAAGLRLTGPDLVAARPNAPLIELDPERVDRIRIEGPEQADVVLARAGDGWVLPALDGFPVSSGQSERLLDALSRLRRGFAVATSASARSRLRVAEDAFERRVTVYSGDTPLGTLYFGTSTGAQQVHARTGDDEGVYVVEFGVFDASADSEDWQDATTLQLPRERIRAIVVGDLTLRRAAEPAADGAAEASESPAAPDSAADESAPRWTLEGGPADASVDSEAADTLADRLAGLRTGAVLGTEPPAGYGLDMPELELTVITTEEERVDFLLAARADSEQAGYALKSSARPEYFELRSFTAEQLIDAASSEELIETADAAGDESAEAPPAEG